MEVQAALGSDIALVFDECTPFHVSREYTARSTERTHRWLDRCLAWHAAHGPEGQVVYGIVQGGVDEDLRRWSAREVAARDTFGLAIGGTLGEDKDADVRGRRLGDGRAAGRAARATCSASARSTTSCAASSSASTPSTARCRRGSAATGWRSCPTRERAGASTSRRRRWRDADEPLLEGCPCPACAHGYSRAYLHYLLKARETTGMRLVTLHNLAYLQRLMAALRDAIDAGPAGGGRGRRARRRGAVGAAWRGLARVDGERVQAPDHRLRQLLEAQHVDVQALLARDRAGPLTRMSRSGRSNVDGLVGGQRPRAGDPHALGADLDGLRRDRRAGAPAQRARERDLGSR